MKGIPRLFVALLASATVVLTGCSHSGYQEKGSVWTHDDVAFAVLDPTTFKPLGSVFARDAKTGYFRGAVIAGSDGDTFQALSDHEARDVDSVFYCDIYRSAEEYWAYQHLRMSRIPRADPSTYRVLAFNYARDAERVYFEGTAFPVRDVATFEPLDYSFARDAKTGYFEQAEVPGSDGATFTMVSDTDAEYARDRASVYHATTVFRAPREPPQRIVKTLREVDLAHFRTLGRGYASDGQRVWYRGEPLPSADVSTFTVDPGSSATEDARDRAGPWQQGRRTSANASQT